MVLKDGYRYKQFNRFEYMSIWNCNIDRYIALMTDDVDAKYEISNDCRIVWFCVYFINIAIIWNPFPQFDFKRFVITQNIIDLRIEQNIIINTNKLLTGCMTLWMDK